MEEKNSYLSADPETIRQIDEKMPPEEELQDLAEFFKVFGDATRLKILSVLLCSEMCVYDIATLLGMSQSAISHQLRVLKQMDLVKNRRDGKTIFYALADDHIVFAQLCIVVPESSVIELIADALDGQCLYTGAGTAVGLEYPQCIGCLHRQNLTGHEGSIRGSKGRAGH